MFLNLGQLYASFAVKLDQSFGKTIAIGQNYETISMIGISTSSERTAQSMVNFSYIDSNKWATNFGLSVRRPQWGMNVFFDQLKYGKLYQQIGFGLEFFKNVTEWRANFYLPISKSDNTINAYRFDYPGDYLVTCREVQYAMWGMDGECAKRLNLPRLSIDGLFALGGYAYFPSSYNTCIGGRLRFNLSLRKYFRLETMVTYDPVYHTLLQAVLSLTVPFYEMSVPIYRQNMILRCKKDCYWWTNY